jgi:hypothetical protein
MAGHVGLNECLEHSVAGSVFLPFDKVERGTMDYEAGDAQENIGTGGQVAYYRDMVIPVGNATTMLQSINLLSCVKPTSLGVLPPIIQKIHGGPIVTTNAARLHEDCYLRRVKLSCSVGKPVMVEYEWIALLETEKTTIASAVAKSTNTPVMWHNGDVDISGSGYKAQSWELELVNEIVAQTSQDTKAAGVQRLPEWIDPGNFVANISVTTRTNPGLDFSADFPAVFEFAFTGLDNETSAKTLNIDCASGSGFQLQGDPLEIVSGGDAVSYQIKGKSTNDLSIVGITFA